MIFRSIRTGRTIPRLLVAAACAVLIAGVSAATAQMNEGVTVISSDAKGFVVRFTPSITTSRLPGGEILPTLPGSHLLNGSRSGEPMEMVVDLPVALPSRTGSTVDVIAAEYDAPVGGRIAPVPGTRQDGEGFNIPVYTVNPAAYARSTPALPPAQLVYLGIARDVHAGAIQVAPVQFDRSASTLRFLRSITVRLRYGGLDPAISSGQSEGLGSLSRMMFLNAPVAEKWSLAKRSPSIIAKRSLTSSARGWMRVDVKQDGLYDLTAEDFRKGGIDPASIDPSRIAIYGGGGEDLPERISAIEKNSMHQIPTIVETGSDGRVAHVLFYGAGPNTWSYWDTTAPAPHHRISPYVSANSYIVAVDGDPTRGFEPGGTQGGVTTTVTTGIGRVYNEDEKFNAVDIRKGGGSGRDWFGSEFSVDAGRTTDTKVFSTRLPMIDRSQPVFYRIRVANASTSGGRFDFRQKDVSLGDPIIVGAQIGENAIATAETGDWIGKGSDVPGDGISLLGITYTNHGTGLGYLDWFEIHYGRLLKAVDDQIDFDAPAGSGIGQFVVTDFSSNDLRGFDITDPANPRILTSESSDGRFTFRDQLRSQASSHRYFIAARSAARRPDNIVAVPFGDLRNRMLNADILVITHPDFKSVAEDYVAYRNGRDLHAAYVTTDEIYTEFSHGNLDPTAIRDYIGTAMRTWSHRPSHVLLIGDATYDFRSLSTASRQKQYVPIYETNDSDSYDHLASSSFDDYYVRVLGQDGDLMVDLAIGRFPIESVDQGKVIMAKIREYENSRNFGLWRQTLGLVTDDDYPIGQGGGFTGQSEQLWSFDIPGWMETKKIYLANYPTDYSSSNKKPGAAEDLSQTFERGAVMLNWVGHGNPDVWAHEHILVKDDFIPRLANDSMLTYVSAATCNFGYLDEPAHISGAEEFLLHPNGGAIAVMSTTRAVLISSAQDFMYNHYAAVFARNRTTHQYATLGEVLAITKNALGNSDEKEKFFLLGDPALRLNLPHDSVAITRINATPLGDTTNKGPVTVAALSLVSVEGEVLDNTGMLQSDFNGTAIIDLFDADKKLLINSGEFTVPVSYYGGRLFRGPAQVVNGRFTVTFRVPKDISYDSTPGRLFVYAYNDRTDAAGMTGRIRVFGSDTATVTDKGGPEIKIYLDDRSFRAGDIVTPKPLLMLDLADSSGINSSGAGIGHRIEAWIDNNPKSIDLTDSYQTLPTDYRQGTAQRRLLDLEPGEHSVKVRAWDIYNNSSEASSYFRISEADEKTLRVEDVVNFPNPMTRETDFLFRHNQSHPLDAEVSIFTLTGRKVRVLQASGVRDRFVRIHWDGTDADGAPLANGVYLYRLRVKLGATTGEGAQGEQVFETIEKVAIVR